MPPYLKGGWTFSKLAKKGEGIQFLFNKGRDRKKGWDGIIRGRDKENLQNFFNFFKGNPNSQGILN